MIAATALLAARVDQRLRALRGLEDGAFEGMENIRERLLELLRRMRARIVGGPRRDGSTRHGPSAHDGAHRSTHRARATAAHRSKSMPIPRRAGCACRAPRRSQSAAERIDDDRRDCAGKPATVTVGELGLEVDRPPGVARPPVRFDRTSGSTAPVTST